MSDSVQGEEGTPVRRRRTRRQEGRSPAPRVPSPRRPKRSQRPSEEEGGEGGESLLIDRSSGSWRRERVLGRAGWTTRRRTARPGSSPSYLHGYLHAAARLLHEVFLPIGYPTSVSPDYTRYQAFDTLQAFCSSFTRLLTTRASLKRLGVGNDQATATSATLVYVMQDVTGMLGRITFAWRYAGHMDADVKAWRFAADWFNDGAVLVNLAGLLLPEGYTLGIACASALCQALCSVAAASSKAALSTHFAIHENMADLAAKEGSQETLVGLVGLGLSTLILHLLPEEHVALNLVLCLVFVGLHLLANYCGIRSVCLHTLNGQRLYLLVRAYLQQDGHVPSPQALLAEERIFWRSPIRMGVPLERILQHREGSPPHVGDGSKHAPADPPAALQAAPDARAWAMAPDGLPTFMCSTPTAGHVLVALHAGSDGPVALLHAYAHAIALHLGREWDAVQSADLLRRAQKAGWETEPGRSKLIVGGWRYAREGVPLAVPGAAAT